VRQRADLVTAKKENPAVGTPGQTFVVIGVLRFQICGQAVIHIAEQRRIDFLFFSPVYLLVLLFSCSSMTFQI
jgi:hypothetical protein